jgi:hypothetical protein
VTAFARDRRHVFLARRLALRAAIFLIVGDRAQARFVTAFIVFVCHFVFLPDS